jgi:hypothetical protein
VDFGEEATRVEIHSSEETVEIFIEADSQTHPEERRRFALLNIPDTCLVKPLLWQRDGPRTLPIRDFAAGSRIKSKGSL